MGYLKATVFINNLRNLSVPVACSETVANKVYRKRKLKVKYVRNGIDLDKFSVNENIIRSQLGISEKDLVLAFCGYLSKRKNVKFIFDAFAKTQRQDIKLLIIGDGAEYEEIKRLTQEDKRVIMVGRVENSIPYLRISDYFVSASLSEGLPLAVMEGMSVGLIPVLSRIESHEEVKNCCPCAKIFSLDSADELIEILNTVNSDQAASDESRAGVLNYLNAQRMADEYQALYNHASKDKK